MWTSCQTPKEQLVDLAARENDMYESPIRVTVDETVECVEDAIVREVKNILGKL